MQVIVFDRLILFLFTVRCTFLHVSQNVKLFCFKSGFRALCCFTFGRSPTSPKLYGSAFLICWNNLSFLINSRSYLILLNIFILYFTEFASYIDLILFHLSFLFEWNTIRSGTIGYFSHGKPIKVPSSHTVGLIVLLKHRPYSQECGLYKVVVCHALFTLVTGDKVWK